MENFRISTPNTDYLDNAENLQLKLSLKKQIWTGAFLDSSGDGLNNAKEKLRPLSWGMPATIGRRKENSHGHDVNENLLAYV